MPKINCPRCGLVGSVHPFKKRYYRVAHYVERKLYWHYIGKRYPKDLLTNNISFNKLSSLQKTLLKIIYEEVPVSDSQILRHKCLEEKRKRAKNEWSFRETIYKSLRKLTKRNLIYRNSRVRNKKSSLTNYGKQAIEILINLKPGYKVFKK